MQRFQNLLLLPLLAGAGAAIFLLQDRLPLKYGVFLVGALVCAPLGILVIRKYPAVIIPTVFYAGSFKSAAATSGINPTDPTLWALGLLVVATSFHALFTIAGIFQQNLGERIHGQAREIAAYLFFAGVVSASYLYTVSPTYGFTLLSRFLVIGSLLYLSPIILVRDEEDLRHLITAIVLLSSVVAVRRILGIASYSGPSGGDVEDLTKIGAAELVGMGLLLLLLAPPELRARLPRKVLLAILPLMTTGLAVSIARGPILSFVIVLMGAVFLAKADCGLLPRKQLLLSVAILVVPMILLALAWVSSGAQTKVEGKKDELVKILTFSDPGGSAGQRLTYYKLAAVAFTEKPVLGWGIASFSMYAIGRDERLYPHNLILMIAMEQGLVGLLALGFFAFATYRAAKGISFWSGGRWAFFGWTALYLLMITMTSGNLDDHRAPIFWCGVVSAGWRVLRTCLDKAVASSATPQYSYNHLVPSV